MTVPPLVVTVKKTVSPTLTSASVGVGGAGLQDVAGARHAVGGRRGAGLDADRVGADSGDGARLRRHADQATWAAGAAWTAGTAAARPPKPPPSRAGAIAQISENGAAVGRDAERNCVADLDAGQRAGAVLVDRDMGRAGDAVGLRGRRRSTLVAVVAIVTLSVPTAVTLPVSGATKSGRSFLVPLLALCWKVQAPNSIPQRSPLTGYSRTRCWRTPMRRACWRGCRRRPRRR